MIHQWVFTGDKCHQVAEVHVFVPDFEELLLIEGEHHQLHKSVVGSDEEFVGNAYNGSTGGSLGKFLAGAVRVRAADGVNAFEVIVVLITRDGGANL